MPASLYRVIRDPLWNTIRLDEVAVRIIDTPEFQRLRYIRQLGWAHLVYPGATHTRFDHAVGVYHLASKALRLLTTRDDGGAGGRDPRADLIPYAALLHDIGHYAFSHALEELEPERVPGDHEEMAARFFGSDALRRALEPLGSDAPDRIFDLIRGRGSMPLRGLVSGSLDLDKMEYLRRDARFCGVPYGEVDVDRLLQGLALVEDPVTGATEVGIDEKALSAVESLLFAKYQMFRNVYWHHAVRAATALYKRIVDEAVAEGLLTPDELVGPTDEALLFEIDRRARDSDSQVARRLRERWLPALRERRLPKRAVELTAADLPRDLTREWVLRDAAARRVVEDDWAARLGLEPGEVFLDVPRKRSMFELDVLVQRSDGRAVRMGLEGIPGLIDLPRLAVQLYESASVLRVFTLERRALDRTAVIEALRRPPAGGGRGHEGVPSGASVPATPRVERT